MTVEQSRFRYASFERRLAAFLIDGLLLGVGLKLLQALLNLTHVVELIATGGLLLGILRFIYPPFCHVRWRKTLGKHFMKLNVTDLHGRGISWPRALRREIFYLPGFLWALYLHLNVLIASWNVTTYSAYPQSVATSYPLILWGLLGYGFLNLLVQILFITLHPKNRALHDIVAGTVVLDVRPPRPPLFPKAVPCLQCDEIIPPLQSRCPACGWSYEEG